MGRYAKFIVAALASAAAAAVPLVTDGVITAAEWVMIGAAALGALGVWAIPNKENA